MKNNHFTEANNSVNLIFSFKKALDQENYILCKDIKNELIDRKNKGDLNNEIIQAAQEAYLFNAKEYEDFQMEVFRDMIKDILNV